MIQRNAERLHRRNGVDMAVGYDFVNQQCLRNAQRWEGKASSGPYPPLEKAECDRLLGPLVFDSVEQTIGHIGGASILTEFGAMTPNARSPDSLGTEEVEWVLNEVCPTCRPHSSSRYFSLRSAPRARYMCRLTAGSSRGLIGT